MIFNLTVNEGACPPPAPTPEAGVFHVRAFYTETDAGHLFGPFGTREAAEACANTLAGRTDVVKAVIEEGV